MKYDLFEGLEWCEEKGDFNTECIGSLEGMKEGYDGLGGLLFKTERIEPFVSKGCGAGNAAFVM